MSRSTVRFASIACVAALILTAAPAAAAEPLLTDERLIVSNSFGSTAESYEGMVSGGFAPCDAGATTMLHMEVAGNAHGPFSGTFTQVADVTITEGLVESFDTTFEIVAGATTVTGEAHYTASGADGRCERRDDEGAISYITSVGSGAGGGNERLTLDYVATVDAPGGTTTESGVVDASFLFLCADPSDLSGCDPGSTILTFLGRTVPRSASGDGTASTASEATADDPIATTIVNPAGGEVGITELNATRSSTSSFTFLGRTVDIYAEFPASVEDPIRLTFLVDASVLFDESGAPLDPETVTVLRNDVPAGECDGSGIAVPDPCVASRTVDPDTGDLTLSILSSEASLWDVVAATPATAWTFEGFFGRVRLSEPNAAMAGSAVSLTFSLGADRGSEIFAPGYPMSHRIACATGARMGGDEATVQPGRSSLSYDARTGRYNYVWRTLKAWAGTCRLVELRFADDGPAVEPCFDFRK